MHWLCVNEAEKERLMEVAQKEQFEDYLNPEMVHIASLSQGFACSSLGLVVICYQDLFGKNRMLKPRRKIKHSGQVITNFADLKEGDYVVHLSHGIGIYRGVKRLDHDDIERDYLELEYQDGDRLYVPLEQIDLVQKYVGLEKARPKLNRLGSKRWDSVKAETARAIEDMAAQMLKVQADRQVLKGFAFPPDTPWQKEFEEAFPYTETEDQWQAILDVKADMEKPKPMDRLVCGDVGFGKTEVAIRAAFKAVMSGKQVAVLVPTTILAQQHFSSFCARMSDFPVRVEMLSRFRTKAQQKAVIAGMASGEVDIVIGTHRLVQKDIRFKDLGLLIIDEEQRFGVAHKERIKSLKSTVDILTMTATPIPRTLYMSMVGARDMSEINTPPQDRLPVFSKVCSFQDQLIAEAISRA